MYSASQPKAGGNEQYKGEDNTLHPIANTWEALLAKIEREASVGSVSCGLPLWESRENPGGFDEA